MARGHEHDLLYSLSIRNMVFQTFTVYFWGKGDHHYTAQRSFFPLQSYSKKTLKKMPQKALMNTKQNVLMPPWAYHNTP